jgi:uncharacterized membrane protein
MRRMIKISLFCLAFSSLLYASEFRSPRILSAKAATALVRGNGVRRDVDFRFSRIDYPGASATNPGGINARGDIVGNFHDAYRVTHGFLLRKGAFSAIDVPDASFTAARAINARGDIVGRVLGQSGDEHGFLLRDGNFTQIDYPGASATTARGINNSGDVTGRHFDRDGNESGFILKDGKFHNVLVPGSCSTDVWLAKEL